MFYRGVTLIFLFNTSPFEEVVVSPTELTVEHLCLG